MQQSCNADVELPRLRAEQLRMTSVESRIGFQDAGAVSVDVREAERRRALVHSCKLGSEEFSRRCALRVNLRVFSVLAERYGLWQLRASPFENRQRLGHYGPQRLVIARDVMDTQYRKATGAVWMWRDFELQQRCPVES
jgi:hypothetical protein